MMPKPNIRRNLDTYGRDYIDKDQRKWSSVLQTDAPLKRGIFRKVYPQVENALNSYGVELDPMTKEIYTL
jgi:formate C-acetyltransferase